MIYIIMLGTIRTHSVCRALDTPDGIVCQNWTMISYVFILLFVYRVINKNVACDLFVAIIK